jgi:hypothetical protein
MTRVLVVIGGQDWPSWVQVHWPRTGPSQGFVRPTMGEGTRIISTILYRAKAMKRILHQCFSDRCSKGFFSFTYPGTANCPIVSVLNQNFLTLTMLPIEEFGTG